MANALVRRRDRACLHHSAALADHPADGRSARPYGTLSGSARYRARSVVHAVVQLPLAVDRQSRHRSARHSARPDLRARARGEADRDDDSAAHRIGASVDRAGSPRPHSRDGFVRPAAGLHLPLPFRVREFRAVDGAGAQRLCAVAATCPARPIAPARGAVRAAFMRDMDLPHLWLGNARRPRLFGGVGTAARSRPRLDQIMVSRRAAMPAALLAGRDDGDLARWPACQRADHRLVQLGPQVALGEGYPARSLEDVRSHFAWRHRAAAGQEPARPHDHLFAQSHALGAVPARGLSTLAAHRVRIGLCRYAACAIRAGGGGDRPARAAGLSHARRKPDRRDRPCLYAGALDRNDRQLRPVCADLQDRAHRARSRADGCARAGAGRRALLRSLGDVAAGAFAGDGDGPPARIFQ